MIQSYKILLSLILVVSFNFNGCLKDKITPPADIPINDAGEILFFLEEEGDYINSSDLPSLTDADEVYSNIHEYLLIDIRPSEEFISGHIEGAINKQPSQLISFLDSIDYKQYPKIIIISKNGQSSAFYTCLLRLYGFDNTCSMNYGMAAWNAAFSDEWLNALQTDYELLQDYTNDLFPKPASTPLPEVSLSGTSLEDKVKQRIKDLTKTEFEDNLIDGESTAVINYGWLMSNTEKFLIVCYDSVLLYKDVLAGISHPENAVSFHPFPHSELSSTEYLQSIPSNKKSAFYSTNGQLSGFVVAYLRVLGYDAKSVLFGANNMYYDLLLNSVSFSDEAFSQSKIRNYSFVTGK